MSNKIELTIEATVKDSRGNIISHRDPVPCRSLLKQFIQLLLVQFSQAGQTITDIANAAIAVTPHASNLGLAVTGSTTSYGINIGTGQNAVTMLDYKLQTKVTANIAHSSQTFSLENPDDSTWRAVISRAFTNNTGALLSIKEVGLYSLQSLGGNYFCIDRTLYSVDVPSGAAVTLTYRVTISL